MASGSAEHPWRHVHRSHADQDDDDEPEVDAGYHSETDTEEYYNRCSTLSYETISADDHDAGETASSAAVPANASAAIASTSPSSSVARGWGGTGRRGCTGSSARTAISPSPSSEPEQPVASIVAAVPEVVVLHPTPLAFATPTTMSPMPMASVVTARLSDQTTPPHGDAMEVSVAGVAAIANDPPTQAVFNHHEHPTSSSPAAAAEGEENAVVVHQAAPAAAAGEGQQQQAPKVYTCKRCGVTFKNPQALGGHVVGHRNRDLAAAAAAAAAGGTTMVAADGRRGSKPAAERPHVCNECGAEFLTGVQLGGHKRKHYTGAPIVPNKKKKARVVHLQPLLPPPVEAVGRDVTLTLSVREDEVAALPAVETTPAATVVERTTELAPRPAAAGRVLLFGIDIGTGKKMPAEVQLGSPETQTSPSSNGEQ